MFGVLKCFQFDVLKLKKVEDRSDENEDRSDGNEDKGLPERNNKLQIDREAW